MKTLTLIAFVFAFLGCGVRPLIPGVPLCDASIGIMCAPNQTRDGMRCASCTNPDSTLTCQSDDHERVLCVSDCAACDSEPVQQQAKNPVALAIVGVHLCGYDGYGGDRTRRRDGKWCAMCATQDLSATMQLCIAAGYTTTLSGDQNTMICDDVVCVKDCESCPVQ